MRLSWTITTLSSTSQPRWAGVVAAAARASPGVNFNNILRALFCTKVFWADFLYLQFGLVNFCQKNIFTKTARKTFVKSTTGCAWSVSLRMRRTVVLSIDVLQHRFSSPSRQRVETIEVYGWNCSKVVACFVSGRSEANLKLCYKKLILKLIFDMSYAIVCLSDDKHSLITPIKNDETILRPFIKV